jgi:polyhydroxyalkanoate synthesis regulator phasin
MRSKVEARILVNTSEETKQRARAYADELVKQSKNPQPPQRNEP